VARVAAARREDGDDPDAAQAHCARLPAGCCGGRSGVSVFHAIRLVTGPINGGRGSRGAGFFRPRRAAARGGSGTVARPADAAPAFAGRTSTGFGGAGHARVAGAFAGFIRWTGTGSRGPGAAADTRGASDTSSETFGRSDGASSRACAETFDAGSGGASYTRAKASAVDTRFASPAAGPSGASASSGREAGTARTGSRYARASGA
jgi:hypothetical protein